jgi:regulator of protease activity HflC (stomatin/prohibitin superfamily)
MPRFRIFTVVAGIGAAFILLLLIIGVATMSRQRTAANEWGCSFGSGPVERTRQLKNRLAPGESGGYSNDTLKTGPADIRFYFIDTNPQTADFGATPIVVPAKGSSTSGVGVVQTSTEVQVRFVINENFCDFYVNHLKRVESTVDLNYNAKQGEESGWASVLNQTMNQKLIEATRPVLRDVDYITLYTNGAIEGGSAYDVLARELSTNLTRELNADLGKEYFCGPSYKFDGTIDGEFDNGCPPLEVTVKSITPVNPDLITNLQAIVNNEEQQRKIESDTRLAQEQTRAEQERAIAVAQANQEKAVAQAAADQATQVAQAAANQEIQVAQATADQNIKVAQARADQQIKVQQAESERAVQTAQNETRRANEQFNAETDLLVAQARGPVATQLAANKTADLVAQAQYCVTLAASGIRCDLLAAAEAGTVIVPTVNLSGTADGGSAGTTVVLDARP